MRAEDASEPEHRSVSRRTVILAAGAAVVVGGGAIAYGLTRPGTTGSGYRPATGVRALLAKHDFRVAHHGGDLDWPPMTLYGYQQCVDRGVDALEISLARTADGVYFGLDGSTLDQTSGTAGFVVAQHTWAEVQQHLVSAAQTNRPTQPARPYLRVESLVRSFAQTHTIFVDPKNCGMQYYDELLALLGGLVEHPTDVFVAKAYYHSQHWAQAASARGYASWGYYYASDLAANPDVLARTQSSWTMLGLDYGAPASDWSRILEYRKPVIAHVIESKAEAHLSERRGARGLMISGVREVVG